MRRMLMMSCLVGIPRRLRGQRARALGRQPEFRHDPARGLPVVTEAFQEGLIPAFTKQWKAKTGRDVTFEQSYNGSGAQAKAIKGGQPVDIAVLSLEDDMDLLGKAGLVKNGLEYRPQKGDAHE